MDTLSVCEAIVSEDVLSKAPRGRPRKVEGLHAQESSLTEDQTTKGVGLQPVQSMVLLKSVSFKSAMRIPGAGGESVHWVTSTETPPSLAIGLHSGLQCVSITRKGVTYYSPLSNVLFFEML